VRSACDTENKATLVGQRMAKYLVSQAPPCFGRYAKPLDPAFALIITHQSALGPLGGLWPVVLMCNHKEGLCPSSGDINRLMMMMMNITNVQVAVCLIG
jgi:hypothetical protein